MTGAVTLVFVLVVLHSLLRRPISRVCASPRVVGEGPRQDRRERRPTFVVVVGVVAACLVNVVLGLLVAVGAWAWSIRRRRRRSQDQHDDVAAGLADVIDLFAVALHSGSSVAEAVEQVGEWTAGPLGKQFAWSLGQARDGRAISDALDDIPGRLGPRTQPLIAALVATDRYGAPIVESLARLAADTRADRRRRAETAARRLPVALLFPLVVCVLPAFLLVTVVPAVAETLSNFSFSASP